MSYDNVLVVEIRTPDFALVLAARGKHVSGWGIVWTSYHFADVPISSPTLALVAPSLNREMVVAVSRC